MMVEILAVFLAMYLGSRYIIITLSLGKLIVNWIYNWFVLWAAWIFCVNNTTNNNKNNNNNNNNINNTKDLGKFSAN